MKLDEVISKLEEIRKEYGGDIAVSSYTYEGQEAYGQPIDNITIEVNKETGFYSPGHPQGRKTFVMIWNG